MDLDKKMKVIKCKYCSSEENLKKGNRKGIDFFYPVCINCIDIYQQDKLFKREKTNLEKYGIINVAQIKEFKNKREETNIKKYGVKNPMQNKEIKNKAEQTLLENYGVTVPAKNKEILLKMKQTSLDTNGYENPIQNPEIKKKAKRSTLEHYGVENPFSSKEIQKQIEEKRLLERGVRYSGQLPEVKEKIRKSQEENFGGWWSQNKDLMDISQQNRRENYWDKFITVLKEKYLEPLFDKDLYINELYSSKKYKCLRCGKEFDTDVFNPHQIFCGCSEHRSYFEEDIITWLNTLGSFNIKNNDKFYTDGTYKYEIDIHLVDLNLGIEFNGIYWHSDLYRNKQYHQNKYKYFKEKGINLIQIFENEWIYKEEIVKSIIKNKLKLNESIFARKCTIKEISDKDYKEFLLVNHLQGYTSTKIKLGLFYKNELYSVMGLGKNRFSKEDSWELIRFCNKINYNVVGGFQKLLKYFEINHNPVKLISFIDIRYFDGKGYISSGFILDKLEVPNYFYFKEHDKELILHSRQEFQKHKLKDKLEIFDENLSEYENMLNNGYLRIFDAGNIKMIKLYEGNK